jgi:hypothetical protein
VRHLVAGQPCPIDGAAAGRVHCSGCPSFVSYRLADDLGMVGCDWGEDVPTWLRREMRRTAPTQRPITSAAPRRVGRLGAGTSLGIFLAALGVGLVVSAFERPA